MDFSPSSRRQAFSQSGPVPATEVVEIGFSVAGVLVSLELPGRPTAPMDAAPMDAVPSAAVPAASVRAR